MRNFCAICGVHVRSLSAEPEPGLPVEDLEWHQEIRAVRHVNSSNTTTLTGVGYLNVSEIIIAPPDPEHSYRDDGVSLESYVPFYDSEIDAWTFLFHAACWEVLRERISNDPSDTSRLAALFYSTLHCTALNEYNYLRPGHDFGGVAKFQRPYGNPLQEMINAGLSAFAAEPLKFAAVDDILHCLESTADITVEEATSRIVVAKTTAAADIFSKLPVEVVHLLLSWLPSHDILNLRLASKSVASVSRADSLPQSFWRSRFAPDFELGFSLPTDVGGHPDWRDLYFRIGRSLQTPHGSARLRNRKRVWEIIGKNAALLSLHLRGTQLHGVPISWDDFSGSKCGEKPSGKPRSGKIIATESITRDSETLRFGSREISVRRLLLQPGQQTICAVGVSTVTFNSRIFVSGLRVFFRDSVTGAHGSHSLGYVAPNSEHLLEIAAEESFAGLELATSVDGIVGVRVILEAGPRRYSSPWVGNIGKGEPDIAFGQLLCSRSEIHSFDFAASFDAFKMIALAVIDIEYCDTNEGALNGPEKVGPPGLVPQPIWTPCYPEKATLIPAPQNPKYQAFNPILNINFGGVNGENLQKLTRIVAHMGEKTAPFVGIVFEFDGQPSRLYGRQGRTEVSFFIDGARGERISAVTYEQASTSIGIWSLEIHTNFGRRATFIPDELRTERPGEPFPGPPFPFFDAEYHDEVNYSKKTLRAPEGQVITGFTSILEASSGTFQTFGLQCSCVPDSDTPMACGQTIICDAAPRAAELCSSVGCHLIGGSGSGCTAYTHASLNGVQRIRFSRGSPGRPRQANEISGLWLDYFESRSPAIVGQWLSEADSMSFEPDEKVIEMSIWISKLDYYFNERFHRGRVIGISVLTSRMQRKTVKSVDSVSMDDCMELKFRANKLEKLASLVWAFNALWDHPRVLSLPNTDSDRIRLWDPRSYYSKFPWMAPEKILREDACFNNKEEPDRIVAVAAYRTLLYGVKYITGLVFTYMSGATRTVGYTHGEPSREVFLGDNERIACLELLSGPRGLFEITLHCESLDDEHTRSEPRKLVGEPIAFPDSPTLYHDWIYLSASRYKEDSIDNNKGSCRGLESPKYPLSNDKAVGLWGFNVAEGNLILGAIYAEKA